MNDVTLTLADDSALIISPDVNGNIILPSDVPVKSITWITPKDNTTEGNIGTNLSSTSPEFYHQVELYNNKPPLLSWSIHI